MPGILLENAAIRLTVSEKNGTFACLHKETGVTWGADPWKNSLGEIAVKSVRGETEKISLSAAKSCQISSDGQSARITLSDFFTRLYAIRPDRALGGNITCVVSRALTDTGFRFTIEKLEIDSEYWRLESVSAPPRAFPVLTVTDNGYTLLPFQHGSYVPSNYRDGYFRYLNWMWESISNQNYFLKHLYMNWYSAAKENSGYTAIIETPFDCSLCANINNNSEGQKPYEGRGDAIGGGMAYSPRLTGVTPIFGACFGSLGYARSILYTFEANPTIASLAKIYRAYAIGKGYFRSLADKAKENPNVRKLYAGPDIKTFIATRHILDPDNVSWSSVVFDGLYKVNTPFEYAGEMAKSLQSAGVKGGVIHMAGYTRLGYDNTRPVDTLPINRDAGGEADMIEAGKRIKESGMLFALHDNYRNFDLNSPSYDRKYISIDEYGQPAIGFTSEGGPSHQLCSQMQLELLRKNSDYFIDTIGVEGYFLDTIAATYLVECYSKEHPTTRTQDMQNKSAMLKDLSDRGMVVGAEMGAFWAVPYCAFFEGIQNATVGIACPLMNLVFHDAVVTYRHHSNPYNYEYPRGSFAYSVLSGLVAGNSTTWCLAEDTFPGWKNQIIALHGVIDELRSHIAEAEMTAFAYESDDLLVQTSAFSDGTAVAVNMSSRDYACKVGNETRTVPLRGFVIRYPDGKEVNGSVEYAVSISAN